MKVRLGRILGCALALLLAAYLALCLIGRRDTRGRETLALIRTGMNQSEVKASLGVRRIDISDDDVVVESFPKETYNSDQDKVWEKFPEAEFDDWYYERGLLVVAFDRPGGVVCAAFFYQWELKSESLLDKLRRWLGM